MIDLCYVNLAKLKLCFSKFLFLSASGLDLTTKKFFSGFGGQNKAALFMLRRFVQSQAQLQLKSTDSHCWHGTAIGPIVPSVPTFRSHSSAFNSWAKFSYMKKDAAPFAGYSHHWSWRFWRQQETDVSPIHPCRHHIILAGSSLPLLSHTSCIFLLPDYLPSRLQVQHQKHKQQSHTSCLTSSQNCINVKSL